MKIQSQDLQILRVEDTVKNRDAVSCYMGTSRHSYINPCPPSTPISHLPHPPQLAIYPIHPNKPSTPTDPH